MKVMEEVTLMLKTEPTSGGNAIPQPVILDLRE